MRSRIYLLTLLVFLLGCQSSEELAPTPTTASTELVEGTETVDMVLGTATAVTASTLPPPSVPTAPPAATTAAPEDVPTATATIPANLPAGALIGLTMPGQVGVLLDEIPADMRDRVAASLLDETAEFWTTRAQRQVKLMTYRLNFRPFIQIGKGQLPLPPAQLWQINLSPDGPQRQTIDGHDLVLINYQFSATLLTSADSPAAAEPELGTIGGQWVEQFILPLDPDLLLQRTGNACLNEAGFPPHSYDSENVFLFYDHDCTADSGGAVGCHRNQLPSFSCQEMLDFRVGKVATDLRFERLAWDEALADAVRVGPIGDAETADLLVYGPDLRDYRITYRYFTADDCAIQENAVGGSGWRRLLQFSATAYNIGGAALHIGPVITEDPSINVFRYNACHDHFHFDFYGTFALAAGDIANASKQAFCVESTNRFSNNESSPLTHPYSCTFQGVQAGWVDEYAAGLDTQWMDITDVRVDEMVTADLTFHFNPEQFLCEGAISLNDDGSILWEASGLRTATGFPISKPVCDSIDDWDVNNEATEQIPIPPTGSFVTEPCLHGELGPLRNCGFVEQTADLTCDPGATVSLDLQIPANAAPQVARICETSAVLGVGTACTFTDALANVIVAASGQTAEFTCPLPRATDEPGGLYALYIAPVFPSDQPLSVTIVEP
ncbi:MAG: hypothetical protein H6658_15045 [Ardenticatenaceae bacterium]|nr:hypothetical protein [Ardenticatenaceae bacterium]